MRSSLWNLKDQPRTSDGGGCSSPRTGTPPGRPEGPGGDFCGCPSSFPVQSEGRRHTPSCGLVQQSLFFSSFLRPTDTFVNLHVVCDLNMGVSNAFGYPRRLFPATHTRKVSLDSMPGTVSLTTSLPFPFLCRHRCMPLRVLALTSWSLSLLLFLVIVCCSLHVFLCSRAYQPVSSHLACLELCLLT